MIDYEKLKLLHALVESLSEKRKISISLAHKIHIDGNSKPIERFDVHSHEFSLNCFDADALINEMHEFMRPKPKYGIEQQIWFLNGDNEIKSACITEISGDPLKLWLLDNSYVFESEAFASREDLIEAQIEYWKSFK